MNHSKYIYINQIFRILFCFTFLFGLAEQIIAQKLTDTISLREVKIIGNRTLEESGLHITRLDSSEIKLMRTLTISELLTSFSPIFIKSYGRGSTASASFRGTAASHTQLYWNGLKLNSPMRGDVDFSLFPVYFIDDISLLSGGSSIQSGSGALGGSVLINNKTDWTNKLNIRYVQTFESFSTFKENFTVGFGNSRIQLKSRVYSDRSENDFPYFNYGVLPMHSTIQKDAGYSRLGFLQEGYSRFGNHSLSIRLLANKSHRNLPQLMSFEGDIRKETQDDQNINTVASWRYFAAKTRLEWVGGFSRNELSYFRSSTEAGFVNFDSKSKERSFSSQFNFGWKPYETLSFNWTANTTLNRVSIFDKAQQTGYDHDRFEFSFLNAIYFQAFPEVSLSLLSRTDLYDRVLIGFIPSFSIAYNPAFMKTSEVKLNLARNYHQPGLNDLYWMPGGNRDLKPEDGFTGDLTYRYSLNREKTSFSSELSGFASLIDNWIVWQPSANGAYYWEASNVKKVFSRGIEFQISLRKAITNAISFNLRGNYSHTATANLNAIPSVDESRGKQLIYIPKDKANLYAELNCKSWFLKINAPFTGKRYTSSNNVESDYEKVLNPYWLINLTCGKSYSVKPFQVELAAQIENLANTDYMAILWRPMPGRYYSFTMQIQYKK